jgi:hypothetical protein
MAEDKNSFAQWLGRMWEIYRLGREKYISAQQEAYEDVSAQAFLKWLKPLANLLWGGHKQEREIKEQLANATAENIENIMNNFSDDFNAGKESITPKEEEAAAAVEQYTNTGSVEGIKELSESVSVTVSKAEIESQMGAAFGVDDTIQEAVTSEEETLSEEELLKQTGPTGGLEGKQLADYLMGVTGKEIKFDEETKQLRYVLDDNGEIKLTAGKLSPTAAYQAATGSNMPVDWLQNPDGSVVVDTLTNQPIPLAFTVGDDLFADGEGIDRFIKDFIKPKATTAMVRELEDWLIDLGLASEDDFADDGLWSDTLEKGLRGLMEFANQNYSHVQPGTNYYNAFLERVPDNFQWTGGTDIERVGWALIGQAALDVQERWPGKQKGLRAAELSRIKSAAPMPGFNEMRLQIKYWIEAEGGDASEEAINKYVKQWIADQEGFYDDTVSLYDANELNNQFRYFIRSTGQYIDSKWGQSLMGDIAPGTEVGDSWNDQSIIVDREDKSDIIPEQGVYSVRGAIQDEYAPKRIAAEQRERQRQLYYAASGRM